MNEQTNERMTFLDDVCHRHPPIGPAGGPQQQPVDLWPQMFMVTNRAGQGQGRPGQGQGRPGQGGQGSRYGGPGEVPFLLKKSLGKTEGPAFNQTKIQFKKNYFHYRTY